MRKVKSPFNQCHYLDVYRNSGKNLQYSQDFLRVTATQSQYDSCTVKKGDVLFTSSSETPDDIGHCVTIAEDMTGVLYGYHLACFRSDKLDWRYSKFFFSSNYVRSSFSARANGITRYGLTYDDFKELYAIVPPISVQRAIATFLDHKTTQIDALIADKERMIELLEERRQALITEAVTRGLDPNAPMKDSGVEWIGQIPEGWHTQRIKTLRACLIMYTTVYQASQIIMQAS